jgi:hypothetical protein
LSGNKFILIIVLWTSCAFAQIEQIIDQKAIFKLNDSIAKIDSIVLTKADTVPFFVVPQDSTNDTIYFDSNDQVLNIGLCLPLLIDSVYSQESFENSLLITNKLINGAFDFYCGAHMAFDSLQKKYPFIHLYIFDSSIDTFNIDSLLKDNTLAEMDIIVGPLLDKYFKKMMTYCDTNNIYIVSPSKNAINNGSEFYRKSTAPLISYYDTISNFLLTKYDSRRQKVIISQNFDDAKIIEFNSNFNSIPNAKKLVVAKPYILEILDSSTIEVIDDSIIYILGRLDHRIIFINSVNESFVYKVFSELDKVKDSIHFTVIGLPNWENFKSIDISFYNNFNVIFGSTYYVNYKDPEVARFRENFIYNYRTEPSKFAFLGYDNMFFTIEDLISPVEGYTWKGLSSSYHLSYIVDGEEQIFKENSYFHILQFLYGQIVKIQ